MQDKPTILRAVTAEQLSTAAGTEAIAQAADILRAGGTVAFPTETVYGLGANALDAASVAKIFAAKQRPFWDPLIVHVTDAAMLARVVAEIPAAAQRMIDAFWPGPLTLLLPRNAVVPAAVTAGRELVGVRMPAHPVAQALIAACNLPIAAPSANRFGHISPTTAAHVLDDLGGRIDMVLDGGPTTHGVESTVLEVRETDAVVYRPGAISIEALQAVAGNVFLYKEQSHYQVPSFPSSQGMSAPESLPSPGVGMRHYAPRARLVLVDAAALQDAEIESAWVRTVQHAQNQMPKKEDLCGVLLPHHWPLPEEFRGLRFDWGSWSNPAELAQRLYAGLRALDSMGAAVIVCPVPGGVGIGAAIRDRILKAARED
ncbi:MAG TPA: L-threonylcarbamoyladenylate synthase [Acidobacteriaceae bacterium]|jgi:L-threonylcarbamoyladenylate synthase|nr:L-threonylcarbamoyladenylate synthase [Acidobacteriaceae bacterium]